VFQQYKDLGGVVIERFYVVKTMFGTIANPKLKENR
jgi:hypothetical protein